MAGNREGRSLPDREDDRSRSSQYGLLRRARSPDRGVTRMHNIVDRVAVPLGVFALAYGLMIAWAWWG